MIKAVFIDIDETLTNSNREITQNTKNEIKKCINKGIKIILTSGRSRKEAIEYQEQAGTSPYIISSNGASCYDKINNVEIYNNPINKENLKDLLRPNHADYPARIKFKGFNDIRGGGHFSGRITLPLTFAGAIAIDILEEKGIKIFSHIKRILDIKDKSFLDFKEINLQKFENLKESSLPFIENNLENKTKELLEKIKLSGNSVGGEIECACFNLPVGLGSPFFDSLESKISHLAFSVPAIKGISFGIGFDFANILGSEANDLYYLDNNEIKTKTNNNGGILGGLSTGMPLVFSVVVKPTSSISLEQKTINIKEMKEDILKINGRHDACIVPRVLPVIEAVMALAILDEIL
mgnify:CR=1 FL=1